MLLDHSIKAVIHLGICAIACSKDLGIIAGIHCAVDQCACPIEQSGRAIFIQTTTCATCTPTRTTCPGYIYSCTHMHTPRRRFTGIMDNLESNISISDSTADGPAHRVASRKLAGEEGAVECGAARDGQIGGARASKVLFCLSSVSPVARRGVETAEVAGTCGATVGDGVPVRSGAASRSRNCCARTRARSRAGAEPTTVLPGMLAAGLAAPWTRETRRERATEAGETLLPVWHAGGR